MITDAFVMEEAAAAALRQLTVGRVEGVLDPRLIEAGPWAQQYFLRADLSANADFADIDFAGLTLVEAFDTQLAWPVPDEEDVSAAQEDTTDGIL